MRLTYLGPAALLAAGALTLAADPVPGPPAAGVVPQRANTPPSEDQQTNGPALSPPAFESTESRVIENSQPASPQPPVAAPVQPTVAQPPAASAAIPPAPVPSAFGHPVCAPVTPVVTMPTYATCPTSACGPFGPPMFGNAPGPGTGVAVPPVPPAYLAAPTGFYGPEYDDYYGPPVDGIHPRYPYYSYRRPWYTAGPASANVTIVW